MRTLLVRDFYSVWITEQSERNYIIMLNARKFTNSKTIKRDFGGAHRGGDYIQKVYSIDLRQKDEE